MRPLVGRTNQRGFALVAVLLIIVLLSIFALSMSHTFRTEVRIVETRLATLQDEAATEAALNRTIYALQDRKQGSGWRPGGSYRFSFEGREVEIEINDELGKVDLNLADEALLQLLISHYIGEDEDAPAVLDAIQDWKDKDTKQRPKGAEAAVYRAASLPVLPRNRAFESVSELQWVKGITPALYACLAPHLTVHSHRRTIDSNAASAELTSILGVENMRGSGTAVSAIQGGLGGRVLEILIKGSGSEDSISGRRFLVRLTENRDDPVWILEQGDLHRTTNEQCVVGSISNE